MLSDGLAARGEAIGFELGAARREDAAVAAEAEEEAGELEVGGLVRREDFVDAEVLLAVDELFDEFWEIDRRAFGAGAIFADPADALFGEV